MQAITHILRAEQLVETRRINDAIKELELALGFEPNNSRALWLMSTSYFNIGDYDRSMAFARSLVAAEPDSDYGHYMLALNFNQQQKPEKAEEHIRRSLSINPNDADYYAFLGQLYMDKKEWEKALEYAAEGLANDAENAACLNIRSITLTKLGRGDELKVSIAESLSANPQDAGTHAAAGWSKLETRKYSEAKVHFAEALRLDPNNEWARSGMIEALKAKNIFYRGFLQYFFWVSKFKNQTQWAIIIIIYFGQRVLRFAAKGMPFLYIPYFILIGFSYLTWIIDPLFNLVVLTDRHGRYLLDKREKTGAIFVGSGLGLAMACLVLALSLNLDKLFYPAIYFASIIIPVATYYGLSQFTRNLAKIGIFTAVLAAVGGIALVLVALGLEDTALKVGILYLIGIMAFSWVANYISMKG